MDSKTIMALLRLTSAQKFALRKQVVQRVKSGESVTSVASDLPGTARTVYRWVARFSLGGFAALQDRKRTERPRKWTEEQAAWICRIVADKTPAQYQFEFALWTAPLLREAWQQQFGVRLSTSTVRRILRLSKFTPPRPQRRVAQGDLERVRDWQERQFAALNPVEQLWALVNRKVSRQLSRTKAPWRENLEAALQTLKASPELVRAFFRETDCQYILA